MQIAWRRGFFRLWVVLAVVWVAVVVWQQYPLIQWGMKTSSGDCWKRFAHWPDGEAFAPWDTYPRYHPGEPPSDRDRWAEAAAQKIQDCEAAEAAGLPITRRIAIMIEDNWADIGSSLALILSRRWYYWASAASSGGL